MICKRQDFSSNLTGPDRFGGRSSVLIRKSLAARGPVAFRTESANVPELWPRSRRPEPVLYCVAIINVSVSTKGCAEHIKDTGAVRRAFDARSLMTQAQTYRTARTFTARLRSKTSMVPNARP